MNIETLGKRWQDTFYTVIRQDERSPILKQASLEGHLRIWTKELTGIVIKTCTEMGWQSAAKNYKGIVLPIMRNEYLALDVMAFPPKESKWKFPVAVFELENSSHDDIIEYALWKIVCVRANLRVLFCYRKTPDEGAQLIATLNREVMNAMKPEEKVNVEGETIICIGNRHHAGTFPYDYFRWWHLDQNVGTLTRM
jgi:hypothetical protein